MRAETFRSAMREYAEVTVCLVVADLLFAIWLVADMPAGLNRFAMYLLSAGVLVACTLLMWLAFAAKHWLWVRHRIKQTAAAIVEMNDGAMDHQHATDLLTCPGPCSNLYGCLVGVCVIAAINRHCPPPKSALEGPFDVL